MSARVVAAATPMPAPAAAASRRRAADVVVVGNSLQAYAAAYLLAKRGKRAVLVEHAAPQLAQAAGGSRPDIVLHLPATTPHLVNEATEAFALWRGIEAASGSRSMLQLCGSIDVATGGGDADAVLGMMQEAGKAANLPFGLLAADEVAAALPRLRPPRRSAALFTNQGGVVQRQVAAAALLAMAQRAGADVAAGRCLLGWRDSGSHFALRTAPNPAAAAAAIAAGGAVGDKEVSYEAEQLLLVPDAAVQRQTLALFGLSVPGAALWQVPAGRWGAQEECASLPVWQLLGSGSSRTMDDPTTLDSCWGLPLLDWGPRSSALVAQSLKYGQPAEQQEQQPTKDASKSGSESQQQQQQQQEGAATLAAAGDLAAELAAVEAAHRPGSEEAVDAERQRQAEVQRQQQVAEQRMATTGSLAAGLVSGIGGRLAGQDSLLQFIATPDGEPAAGSHPGYEQGRIVAAFPATSSALGCLPGDQLAPLVAKMALNELLGRVPEAVDATAVRLGREALQAEATAPRHDTWAELTRDLC